jgi:hypothetical protein
MSDFNIVRGSDFYNSNTNNKKDILIKYFQISMFDNDNNKRYIRMVELKQQNTNGVCHCDYKIINIKEYELSKKNVETFINKIDNLNDKNIKYKFYPYVNNLPMPTSEELITCSSCLL